MHSEIKYDGLGTGMFPSCLDQWLRTCQLMWCLATLPPSDRDKSISQNAVFPCECMAVDKAQKASDDRVQYIIVRTLWNSCFKSSCYIVQAAVLLHSILTHFGLPSLLLLLLAFILTYLSSYSFQLPSLDILIFAIYIWRFYPCSNTGQN